MSNSYDPDQARHFVKPDHGPNCLQRNYQQTAKVAPSKKGVKMPESRANMEANRR